MYFIEHPQLHLANVVLFMIRLEVQGLGRKTIETECHFHYALSKVHTINLYLITVDVNLDHPDKVVFVISPLQNFSPPPPHLLLSSTLWKELTMCPHFRAGEYCFTKASFYTADYRS